MKESSSSMRKGWFKCFNGTEHGRRADVAGDDSSGRQSNRAACSLLCPSKFPVRPQIFPALG